MTRAGVRFEHHAHRETVAEKQNAYSVVVTIALKEAREQSEKEESQLRKSARMVTTPCNHYQASLSRSAQERSPGGEAACTISEKTTVKRHNRITARVALTRHRRINTVYCAPCRSVTVVTPATEPSFA